MNRNMWKTTLREIRSSLGRYLAIFAIIALGVGFFSGLKVTKEAMLDSGDRFLKDNNMFDFRLISTLGLTDEDVEKAKLLSGVEAVYGAYQADAVVFDGEREYVARFHSLDEKINTVSITAGRLPEKAGEILADGRFFSPNDIGKTITISENNKQENIDSFSVSEYTVVGMGYSPLYLNYERGTTSVGNGSISYFFLVFPENFSMEVYTDIYLTLEDKFLIYTDEYKENIEVNKERIEQFLSERANVRYTKLYSEAEEKLNDAKKELDDAEEKLSEAKEKIENGKKEIAEKREEIEGYEKLFNETVGGLTEEQKEANKDTIASYWAQIEDGKNELDKAESDITEGEKELAEKLAEYENGKQEYQDGVKELENFKEPSTFVLTRSENVGYSCFENDSKIVDGIAVVFPVFFFLVAALVCVTTMSRMIEEQRTQIGVLKALGYSDSVIMGKYMIYSGSAAITGCIGGFFLGCKVFPAIIWKVYGLMYGFSEIRFVFNPILFVISLAVALLCSVGTTWISCKKDLRMKSAELLRPRAPKSGKRIFVERITWLWKRIPFLGKVSVRNIFRYKGRFVMMLLGIGGCTGLVLTGYGIRDSITEIADEQYTKILIYDEQINFTEEMNELSLSGFYDKHKKYITEFMPICQLSVDPVDTGAFRSANLTVLKSSDGWEKVLDLHDENGKRLSFPGNGEVILTANVAKMNKVKVGDTIIFRDSSYIDYRLKVSGICENFFNSYAYINAETYETAAGNEVPYKSAFVCINESEDLHEASADFMNDDKTGSVSVNADTRDMFSKMMQTMNYIVILVIFCAAALAFIVLYNLTNINITERLKEIATIKVLGFYAGETAQYVFRENFVLTLFGAIFGLPVGIALHRYVMYNIKIDMVTFDVHVNPISFVYAILYTFIFALFVDFVMYFKISKINMAESLKSVD